MSAYWQLVTSILLNDVTLHVRVAVDQCLPAELLVLSTLHTPPFRDTYRHKPLFTPNTFLAFFAL